MLHNFSKPEVNDGYCYFEIVGETIVVHNANVNFDVTGMILLNLKPLRIKTMFNTNQFKTD